MYSQDLTNWTELLTENIMKMEGGIDNRLFTIGPDNFSEE